MNHAKHNSRIRRAFRHFGWTALRVALVLIVLISQFGPYTYNGASSVPSAQAANRVPKILNYQARITNAGGVPVPDGSLSVKFIFYDSITGGSCLYSVSGTCGTPTAKTVTVTNGVFSTLLGDMGAGDNEIPETLFDNDSVFLGITISADAEMTPRKRVSAAAYALNADKLDDLDATSSGSTTPYIVATTANGNLTITGDPQGTGISNGSIYINPAAAASSETLFGIASNGSSRFQIDKEGDIVHTGSLFSTAASSTAQFILRGAASQSMNIFEVQDTTTARLFSINATSTQVIGGSRFIVGTTNTLIINSSGNFESINGVVTRFPSAQGSNGQVLTNDGSGNLTWTTPSASTTNLNQAYLNSTSTTELWINGTQGALTIADTFSGSGNIFEIQDRMANDAYSTRYLTVSSTNTSITYNQTLASGSHGVDYSFGALTTGIGVQIASSSAPMTGTLLTVVYSGSSAASTGTVLNLQVNNASNRVKALEVNYPSTTSNLGTGGVHFSYAAAHTGAGFGIDDVTQTGTLMTLNSSALTTGINSYFSNTSNAVTSATTVAIALNQTAATATTHSHDLLNLNQSTTYSTAITTPALTGQMLDLTRNIQTTGTFASTLTLSGALATFSDNAFQNTGTLTSTADVVRVGQNYVTNTGSALNVTSAGTGFALRVNDDGTFTDTSPLVVDNIGYVGIGTTTPSARLTIADPNIPAVNNIFEIQDTSGGGGFTQRYFTVSSTSSQVLGGTHFIVGATNTLDVDSSGNFNKINGVVTRFPSAQGSNDQVLTNDGSGNLTWTTSAAGSSNLQQAYNAATSTTELTINATKGALTIADTLSGTGNIFEIQDITNLATGTYSQRYFTVSSTSTNLTYGASTATGNNLLVQTASTGAFANGGVRFNFTGAHTGSGFQLDDVTTAGTAMTVNANSITTGAGSGLVVNADGMTSSTGNALRVSSTGAYTGSNGLLEVSSVNAGVTGPLLFTTSNSTGAFATGGVNFNFSAAHTGSGVAVNDVTTAGTAMTVNANSITSGAGSGLVVNADGMTSSTGNALRVSSTGAYNGANGLLEVSSANTGVTGPLIFTTSNSTGAFANGGVRFNFTGAHTGSGVLVSDVTTAGTAMTVSDASLTGGTILQLTGGGAMTGTSAIISATGTISNGPSADRGLFTVQTNLTFSAGGGGTSLFESGMQVSLNDIVSNAANSVAGFNLDITSNSFAAHTQTGYRAHINSNGGSPSDNTYESLFLADNSDAASGNQITVTNGFQASVSAGVLGMTNGFAVTPTSGTITNGFAIGATGTVTNGINFSGAASVVTTDFIMQNGESIENNVDAIINTSANTFQVTPVTATVDAFVINGNNLTSGDAIFINGGGAMSGSAALINATGTVSTGPSSDKGSFTVQSNLTFSGGGGGTSLFASGMLVNLNDIVTSNNNSVAGYDLEITSNSFATHNQIGYRSNIIANSGSPTDNTWEALMLLNNADTATGNLIAVTDALLITNTGNVAGGIVNAITIGATTQPITTALNIASTGVTTDIRLQNGEVIHNDTDGTISFTDGTNTLCTIVDGGTTGSLSCTGGVTASTSLNQAYLNSTSTTELWINGTQGALTIADTFSGSGNIFEIQDRMANDAYSTRYLTVSSTSTNLNYNNIISDTALNISATALTTGRALSITAGGTGVTSGSAIFVTTPTTGAVGPNGIVSLNATGAYTGTTQGALLKLTADVTTQGRAEYISVDALTTGVAFAIESTATGGLTTGSLFEVNKTGASGSAPFSGDIAVMSYAHTFNGGTNITNSGNVLDISRSLTFNNATLQHLVVGPVVNISDSTTLTSGNLRHGASVVEIAQNFTSATGTALRVTSSATGGVAAYINGLYEPLVVAGNNPNPTSNLFTVQNTTGAGGIGYTQRYFMVSATSTKLTYDFDTTETVASISANALTTGNGLSITSTGTGLTTGSLFSLSSGTTGAVSTNGIVSLIATGDYTSVSNVGLLNVAANSTTAGTVANISGTALTTGTALNVTAGGVMTGAGKAVNVTASGATTASGVFTVSTNAITSGTNTLLFGATAMTTGGALNIDNWQYNHTAAETGNLVTIGMFDASTNDTGTSFSNALNINTIFSGTTGNGIRELSGVNVNEPTFGAGANCGSSGTGNCVWNAIKLSTPTKTEGGGTASPLFNGIKLTAGKLTTNAADTMTWNGLNFKMPDLNQTSGGTIISTGIKLTGGVVTAGTSYAFTSDANAGNFGIGDVTPTQLFTVGSGEAFTVSSTGTVTLNLPLSTGNWAVCHRESNGASTQQTLVDCANAPAADYMEMYPAASGLQMGDIVMPGTVTVSVSGGGVVPQAVKSAKPYAETMIGVISNPNDAGDFNSIGHEIHPQDNPMPVALKGRVRVKVNLENGPIKIGDTVTSSLTAGVGMKSTKPGMIIGQALEAWNGPGQGMILVFMGNGYHSGLTITTDGVKSLFADDFTFTPTAISSASGSAFSSHVLDFRGSAWDGASNTAVTRDISIVNDVTNASAYQLSFKNDFGQTLASLNNSGDLSLAGSLTINGGFDYAETFPAAPDLDAGDLVMVDPDNTTGYGVKKSDKTYENTLIGVVSTKPGFLTGKPGVDSQPIALAGRVPVKVTTESGEIKAGDPITSSSTAGVGMKAVEAGRVIGIALQGYSGADVGTITIFVNPSWWNGPAAAEAETAGSGLTIDQDSLIDFKNSTLSNVSAIVSQSGAWSVTADGYLVVEHIDAKSVTTEKLALKADSNAPERVVGKAHLEAGHDGILIQNPSVTADSIIMITFEGNPGSNWWISEKHDGLFMLKLAQAAIDETPFTYWIVPIDGILDPSTATDSGSSTVETPPPESEPPPIDSGSSTPPTGGAGTGSGSSTDETP